MTTASIVSMQRVANYGSFLQAWALRELLLEAGCDQVTFSDYHPGSVLVETESSSHISKAIAAAKLGAKPRDFAAYVNLKRRWAHDVLPLLGVSDERVYSPECDLAVLGSDEVWNVLQPNPSVGMAPELFGVGSRAKRIVSYAASFGNTTADSLRAYNAADEVGSYLKDIDAISVRDESSVQTVTSLCGRSTKQHLDPVLAYDWSRCKRIPETTPVAGNYLILYGYPGRFSTAECEAIREYAQLNQYRVVNLGCLQHSCDEFVACDPFEVIACFRGAAAVVTDTFHGTILSVLARVPFATIPRVSNSNKLRGLIDTLGIQAHVPDDPTESRSVARAIEAAYFSHTERVINDGRGSANAYLKEQVSKADAAKRRSYLVTHKSRDCVGCGACVDVCPVHAIVMKNDRLDFDHRFPLYDPSSCVHCGRCFAVCPMNCTADLLHSRQGTGLVAQATDHNLLMRSASGGVSAALAVAVLDRGGVVYGVHAAGGTVHHIRLDQPSKVSKIQGSVYAQSDLTDIWTPLTNDIKDGSLVLFCGTPCQCAAVRRVTGDPESLVTVEVVCEGVPSQTTYQQMVGALSQETGATITDYRFRDKSIDGWSTANPVAIDDAGKPVSGRHRADMAYYAAFKQALTLRESCYVCPFAAGKRCADITIGDAWGAESIALPSEMVLADGLSCVVTSTSKGTSLVAQASLVTTSVSYERISAHNSCLSYPTVANQSRRRDLAVVCASKPFEAFVRAVEIWQDPVDALKAAVARYLPRAVRTTIKRVRR